MVSAGVLIFGATLAQARALCDVRTMFPLKDPPDSIGAPVDSSATSVASITVPHGALVIPDTDRGRLSDPSTKRYPDSLAFGGFGPYGTIVSLVFEGQVSPPGGRIYRVAVNLARRAIDQPHAPPPPVQWQYDLRYEIGGRACPIGSKFPNFPLGDEGGATPVYDDNSGTGATSGFITTGYTNGAKVPSTRLEVAAKSGHDPGGKFLTNQTLRVAPRTRHDFSVRVTNRGPAAQRFPWLALSIDHVKDVGTELGHHSGCVDIRNSNVENNHPGFDCELPELAPGASAVLRFHVTFPQAPALRTYHLRFLATGDPGTSGYHGATMLYLVGG
jgi:hypothetical protein